MRNNRVDIDGICYPRDVVSIDYTSNDYLDHYRDLKLFYKEYVVEELINPFISYTDMQTNYPFQVIDLRIHVGRSILENFNYLKSIDVLLIMLDCL